MKQLIKATLEKSMTFREYESLFEEVVEQKKTTGPNQSESYVQYTKLSWSRQKRTKKQEQLTDSTLKRLEDLETPITILAITETWCGDASRILPHVNKIVDQSKHLELQVVLRDEHEELMKRFLTDGGKSIPIFAFIAPETNEVVGRYGPRPKIPQSWVEEYKAMENKPPYEKLSKRIQAYYNEDKGVSIQEEFLTELEKALQIEVQ